MKKLICTIVFFLSSVTLVYALAEEPQETGTPAIKAVQTTTKATSTPQKDTDSMQFAGNFYFAPQNWSKVGDGEDSKIGFGFGGMFGLGMTIDDMTIAVGPHFGTSHWSADYSKKFQSFTKSVFVNLADVGLEFIMEFDSMQIICGAGSTQLDSGMVLDTGETVMYPEFDKAHYNYTTVGFGLKLENFYIAPMIINYSGYASAADRIEFRCGMTL